MPLPCLIEPLEARIAPAFLANINLGMLDGHGGFKISGTAANDASGAAVSDAGDVNGDGFGDIIIGAFSASTHQRISGASYVVFGKAGGFGANFNLSSLNGFNGFKISGIGENDTSGNSVSAAGDVNGDGFADLIVGAYTADAPGEASGEAYVIFGKAGGFTPNFNLSALNGSNGFKISSGAEYDRLGGSVSGAGDVNGDGFDDVIVGARDAGANSPSPGASYVIFGKAGGFAERLNVATLDGTNGFKLSGAGDEGAGLAVSGGGDINGDGFTDLIVGAPFGSANGPASGTTYVVFGKAAGFAADLSLTTLDGIDGFKINGPANSTAGVSVSNAGDVNGDGFADLIIGASGSQNGTLPGVSYVVFGKETGFTNPLDLSTLNGSNGFRLHGEPGDSAGLAVSGAGDVNGDGFADLIIGARTARPHGNASGASYVVFGKAADFAADFDLSTVNGTNGFKISGAHPMDYTGLAVSGAGDVNGDGFADLIVGAQGSTPHGIASGASYVVFGFPTFGISKNGRVANFPDSDGDILTIKTSQGRFHLSEFTLDPNGGLVTLDLRGHADEFNGANLTFTATIPKGGAGDGLLDVGQILADGVDLGTVRIAGHLGLLHAGDADIRTAGVQALVVDGLGGAGGLQSAITGSLGRLVVHGDIAGAEVSIIGGAKSRLGQFNVGGDITGGSDFHISGNLGTVEIAGDLNAAGFGGFGFHVGGRIGSFNVDGDVVGDEPTTPLVISALGKLGAAPVDAVAIGTLSVGGNVTNVQVLAGYTLGGEALNGDAGIGKIVIDGDFAASSIVAGIADSTDDGFGRNDTLIPGGKANIIATIARITINGTATGSAASGDFFGITAELIKNATIHFSAVALTTGKDDLSLDAVNNDFRLVEV